MKKKLIGVLAIIACLACVTAGCNLTPPPANSDSASASDIETSGLEAAADYLQSMYREDNKETRADYTVIKEVAYDNVIYPITWSVDVTKGVTVKVGEENVKIDVDEGAAENIAYVLTATLTDAEGNTVTVSFSRTVLQAPTMVPVQITEAPVEGTAYKYYVYQGGLGQDMYFAGEMAKTYYFKTTDSFEKGVDIYVEYVTGSTELFNLYFTDSDGVKQYIGVKQSGTHLNPVFDTEVVSSFKYSTDLHSIITTVEDGTECYLGSYESHDTISASKISYATSETSYVGHLVSLVDRSTVTDDLKVEAEKNVLSVAAGYVGEASVELATQGVTYPDVTISWALEGEGATLNGNKLTIAAPEATTSITLKATITSGDVSVEKSFTVALVKNETTAILAAAKELASGAKFGNEATLKGVIKSVDEAYSADFGNVTVTMTVNDTEVECYRLVGNGADVIAAGYTITVTGVLENYQGSVQFGKACQLKEYVAGEAPDTPDTPDVPETEASVTLTIDNLNLPVQTAYLTEEKTVTVDGVTYGLLSVGSYGNGIQCRTKNGLSATIRNTTALAGNIEKIVLTPNAGQKVYSGNAWKAYFGTTADCSDLTVDAATDANGVITINVTGEYKFFKLVHANTYSQYFDSIEIYCADGDVEEPDDYAPMSLSDAIGASDGTKVEVSGTVSVAGSWSDNHGNMNVTIVDAEGETLYIFRLETKVALGDIITVKGEMATYNDARQIAAGATAVITGHDNSYNYVEMTIAEALAADDDTNVIVTGTVVKIGTAYNSSNNDISVDIADDEGTTLYLYKLTGNVTIGQIIKVKGSMATFSGARQIAAGATFEAAGTHTCSKYTEATCKGPAACIVCGTAQEGSAAVEHSYVDGSCKWCGATEGVETATNYADFDTFTSDSNTSYNTRTTTSGWSATNAAFFATHADLALENAITLNGKTGALGTLTSPTLNNGLKTLSFNYGFMYKDTKVKLTINIKDTEGNILATDTIERADMAKGTVYEYSKQFNIEGSFVIEILNAGKSNSTTSNKDRIGIWNLTWVNA